MKEAEFSRKDAGEPWTQRSQVERADLTRLPSGQWYARSVQWPRIVAAPRQIDVKVLTEGEMERLAGAGGFTDFFGGEKLLKDARNSGATVTFWAR